MVERGKAPSDYERRRVQAPGLMRHGPFPGLNSSSTRQANESPSLTEILEDKVKVQAEDIDQLARDNHKMAATHVNLKQELIDKQEEVERLKAHIRSIETESDIQIRVLVDKIEKMEGDLKASEGVKRDLQRAHKDTQTLVKATQELTIRVQNATQELQKAQIDTKNIPKMIIELDNLRQEHERLRATFEFEKGKNIDLVEQLYAMEKNLIGISREVERMGYEVSNMEIKAKAYVNSNLPWWNPGQGDGSSGYSGGYGMAYGSMGTGYWMAHHASKGDPNAANGILGGGEPVAASEHPPPPSPPPPPRPLPPADASLAGELIHQ